jgi:hypothetical protein
MIARLIVVSPFVLIAPEGAVYTRYTYEDDGYTVIARPPLIIGDAPTPHDSAPQIEIGGKPGFIANGLQFEFRKNEFGRSIDGPLDPPMPFLQRIIDAFLARLRFVTRAAQIQPLRLEGGTSWRLEYSNDDGSELKEDPAFCRARIGRVFHWSSVALTPAVWEQLHELEPDWASPIWDDILLDSFNALPKVGTAIVLAATALETFIGTILNQLCVGSDVPKDIWTWINGRRNKLSEPSTEEQFDVLLKHFCGHSLKEEEKLWQAFMELRNARNSFVHGGQAAIGKTPVTRSRATELVSAAGEITRVVRQWLPEAHRWPVFTTSDSLSIMFPILGPPSRPAP